MSFKAPEKYRWENHPMLQTSYRDGNNGSFVIPHHRIKNYVYFTIVSDSIGWEHVSVSLGVRIKGKGSKPVDRCPTWEEMCYIKELFWSDDTTVMQLHPPKSEHVNNHAYCLHLWRPTTELIPLPMAEQVGAKGVSPDQAKKLILGK